MHYNLECIITSGSTNELSHLSRTVSCVHGREKSKLPPPHTNSNSNIRSQTDNNVGSVGLLSKYCNQNVISYSSFCLTCLSVCLLTKIVAKALPYCIIISVSDLSKIQPACACITSRISQIVNSFKNMLVFCCRTTASTSDF